MPIPVEGNKDKSSEGDLFTLFRKQQDDLVTLWSGMTNGESGR